MSGEIGGMFAGIGIMVLCFVMSYFFYQIVRMCKSAADNGIKWDLFDEILLDKFALKKDIDLNKELEKRRVLKASSRSIRKQIKDEIYEDMFGKDKEDKK